MRVLALATIEDARGFGLAGAATRTPRDRRELESALAHLDERRPPIGLVILSPAIAALAPHAVRAFRERPDAPPLVVLPAPPDSSRGPRAEGDAA